MQETILTVQEWLQRIQQCLLEKRPAALDTARQAVEQHPNDGSLLELAAYVALLENRADVSLRFLNRLQKRFYPSPRYYLCRAIASAQSGMWAVASNILEKVYLPSGYYRYLLPPEVDPQWAGQWLRSIKKWTPAETDKRRPATKTARARSHKPAESRDLRSDSKPGEQPPASTALVSPLPKFRAEIPVQVIPPPADVWNFIEDSANGKPEDFLMRFDLARLALVQQFDELLCLPQLRNIQHFWYQVETARKVLKQFHGRVLLADEVGLGKTIEAGMILKEYMIRGMAERVLVLAPPALVGQWREEMESKFSINFVTSHDSRAQRNPEAFWSSPRIIASIAAARRDNHAERLARQNFDVLIVDEAHHLKNRGSRNWKLVDALQKRFLLLLSATPVQNNLIELYNLLTLLKPGIFRTEKEFRSIYISAENPRLPVNRQRLHELMRDVMIRNTRALVDVRLPPRQALTMRVKPLTDEQQCYLELSRLIRELPKESPDAHSILLHHLLEAAGSSPAAVCTALEKFLNYESSEEWRQLHERYRRTGPGAKLGAFMTLLRRNPSEKKMVFVRFRRTLELLDQALRGEGIPFARFDGDMSGPEKDAATEMFRSEVDLLLCTESGAEGKNVQFCSTVINYDLPWNPQVIEQRIGRVHRIGQTREVFIFNLVLEETLEERMLQILEEKINMFELVVGEVQEILGQIEEEQDFGGRVFSAWIEQTDEGRSVAFDRIAEQLVKAKIQYDSARSLDEELFGDRVDVA